MELISYSYGETLCVTQFILLMLKLTPFFFTSGVICYNHATNEAVQTAVFILYF